jgi:AhpD family alkylhydroperoxidase
MKQASVSSAARAAGSGAREENIARLAPRRSNRRDDLLAVSVTNGCAYCIASHGAAARKAGMSEKMFGELMAVVGMANETNRLANGYRVPIDAAFEK